MRNAKFLLAAVLASTLLAADASAQNPTSIFYDDFSVATGWNLVSPDWQIGPATFSADPGPCGIGDPADDADGVPGGLIAGVVIGGNAPTAINGRQYIESPVIPSAGMPGLALEFKRWLNSDYPSFMTNGIDVWDEATLSWVTIWQQPADNTVISDTTWNTFTYDISTYVSNTLQVRFWYEVGSAGVYTCASWNIDNVDFYLLLPGNGQPSAPNAFLDIDGSATNALGNPVSSYQTGLYFATATAGNLMSIQAGGTANQPWVLLGGTAIENINPIAPFGQIDLGLPGLAGLEVIGSGLDGGFLNAAFHCNGMGASTIAITVPASFVGVIYGLQGIMVDPVAIITPTNAVEITFN